MEENYKHAFVILAYKESPYLEECILSLKTQTIQSEILLSTSTPSTYLQRMTEKYELPIIHNIEGDGIASDWSFAYNTCRAKYVTLAHQDDLYLPTYTEDCLSVASKHPGNLITFTDYNELRDGRLRGSSLNLVIKKTILLSFYSFHESLRSPFLKRWLLAFGSPIPCPSVMYNKETIGDFEFSDQFSVNMDWEAWLRLSEMKGAFLFINKKLMTHRIYTESQTSVGLANNTRRIEDWALFARAWPKPIARILSRLYALSYRSNW